MLFKNKEKLFDDLNDLAIKALKDQIQDTKFELIDIIRNIFCKKGVIDFYPTGADKERAKTEFKEWQGKLIIFIGKYDNLMQNYNELLSKKTGRNSTLKWKNNFPSSHELIEDTYKNFFNRF